MWNISRASYYADWFTIPMLGFTALFTDVSYHGITPWAMLMFVFGAFLWTFIENAMHRWTFHRLYRKEHWIHHIRPGAYIGVPGWQTAGLFVLVLGGCWGSLGLDLGGGLFCGIASGYFLYIWAHDLFHHGRIKPGTYWARREAAHRVHHESGKEVNFGVVTPLWDMVLGTYQPAA